MNERKNATLKLLNRLDMPSYHAVCLAAWYLLNEQNGQDKPFCLDLTKGEIKRAIKTFRTHHVDPEWTEPMIVYIRKELLHREDCKR